MKKLLVGFVLIACAPAARQQAERLQTAGEAVCDTAESWEAVSDEIKRLHELCKASAPARELVKQFQTCLDEKDADL
jgi:hypothetical protein